MGLKKILLLIMITILLLSSGCGENKLNKANEYGFESMIDSDERSINSHSIEEYEKLYREIANILNNESMNEVIITVNEEEITRGDFETQKKLFMFKFDEFSVKEIVYSLVKPCVIYAEAKRLNLKVSQDKVEQYMEGVRLAIAEEGEVKGITYACINGRGITVEEYLKEQENMAYNMYKREALYEYIEDSVKNDDMTFEEPNAKIDAYVNNLLKYANIQFYDPEIKEACLAR